MAKCRFEPGSPNFCSNALTITPCWLSRYFGSSTLLYLACSARCLNARRFPPKVLFCSYYHLSSLWPDVKEIACRYLTVKICSKSNFDFKVFPARWETVFKNVILYDPVPSQGHFVYRVGIQHTCILTRGLNIALRG